MTLGRIIQPIAWFRRRDYARHRALDPTLQETFEQWLQNAEAFEKDGQARGYTVARVFLDPEDLVAWCKANGRSVGSQARAELAAHRFADHNAGPGDLED